MLILLGRKHNLNYLFGFIPKVFIIPDKRTKSFETMDASDSFIQPINNWKIVLNINIDSQLVLSLLINKG
jgi:hypothetical protein